MERNNVLLKITDLRQYFPVGKKKGLYVKANDGISLNIYEGETVGLVGESGCGKSTFGRTLLQLYRQTDGKTMYYGASRDELAPEYIEKTIRHLPHGLHELAALEKKRDEMQKVYDAADEQKRLHMHNDLTAAKKAANDAYLNIVNVIGGFITAKDLGPVMKIFSERHDRCCDLHKAIEKRAPVKLDYDEEAFKLSKLKAGERGYDSRKGKLDKLAEKVIYTGAIDAYFDFKLGALEYRSVRFETELLDKPNFQGNAAVNYTDAETPWTRIIEHKWFEFGKDEEGKDLPKTVISREYSSEWKLGDEPYYPVNDEKNGKLYEEYKKLAEKEENIIFGGRLGEYKYYDMDAVIAAALDMCEKEL